MSPRSAPVPPRRGSTAAPSAVAEGEQDRGTAVGHVGERVHIDAVPPNSPVNAGKRAVRRPGDSPHHLTAPHPGPFPKGALNGFEAAEQPTLVADTQNGTSSDHPDEGHGSIGGAEDFPCRADGKIDPAVAGLPWLGRWKEVPGDPRLGIQRPGPRRLEGPLSRRGGGRVGGRVGWRNTPSADSGGCMRGTVHRRGRLVPMPDRARRLGFRCTLNLWQASEWSSGPGEHHGQEKPSCMREGTGPPPRPCGVGRHGSGYDSPSGVGAPHSAMWRTQAAGKRTADRAPHSVASVVPDCGGRAPSA